MSKIAFPPGEKDGNCGCPHSEESYAPDAGVINRAIKGGGTHAVHAWGVIDHHLEDGRTRIEDIAGTSAAGKFNTDWSSLFYLHGLGRKIAGL